MGGAVVSCTWTLRLVNAESPESVDRDKQTRMTYVEFLSRSYELEFLDLVSMLFPLLFREANRQNCGSWSSLLYPISFSLRSGFVHYVK